MNHESDEKKKKPALFYSDSGLVIGAALGLIYGLLLFDEMALGLVFGVAVGLVIGAILDAQSKR